MDSVVKTFLFLLSLTALPTGRGALLDLEIKPLYEGDSFTPTSYSIKCKPGKSLLSMASAIASIEITRFNIDDVFVSLRETLPNQLPPSVPVIRNGAPGKYMAFGKASSDVANSYLQLSIKHPNTADSGQYQCEVYYKDNMGVIQTSIKTIGNLFVSDDDMNGQSVVVRLNALEYQYKVISDDQSNADLQKLIRQNELQLKEIAALKGKVNAVSAFSAGNDLKSKILKNGYTMVFPDVITNVGQGFEPDTGKYTAPIDGIYAFHLFITPGDLKGSVHMNLVQNNKIVASLVAADLRFYDQSAVNAVLKLKKGDEVKVLSAVNRDNAQLYHGELKFSEFSGYLINAL